MNAILLALVVWSLPLLGISCGATTPQQSSTPQSQATPTSTPETITLTTENPSGSFGLKSELVNNPPEVLEVSVTKVVNPASSPVSIFVYLAPKSEKSKSERVEVGNFSLYPVDRGGKFMLSPRGALRKFEETKKTSGDQEVRLIYEMQLPDQNKSSVSVTIASPAWPSRNN